MSDKDTLFETGSNDAGSFVFDERVVRVFPDMIARSVPGYELVVPLTGMLARRYAQDHTTIYDLGCSLGASTLAMRGAVRASDIRIIAVDSSAAMVRHCRQRLMDDPGTIPVDVREADIRELAIENASVVVMNFTLQFLAPEDRPVLLRRIAAGLSEGGVLILSEKICFEDTDSQALQTEWHYDYKRARGYSELEIAGKRTALENVLRADTEAQHRQRLAEAGFSRVERWFQCFGFRSYVAFR
jgi:tRNA (cmo5U34)-methyltransferase